MYMYESLRRSGRSCDRTWLASFSILWKSLPQRRPPPRKMSVWPSAATRCTVNKTSDTEPVIRLRSVDVEKPHQVARTYNNRMISWDKTRSALDRSHLPPTTVFRRLKTTRCCFDGPPIPVRGCNFPDVIKFQFAALQCIRYGRKESGSGKAYFNCETSGTNLMSHQF